jgi:hypothetical protein
MTYLLEVREQWPQGISNGLTLACGDCGKVPAIDYIVDDDTWQRLAPLKHRHSVICLPCLIERGGEEVLAAVKSLQYTISGTTLVLAPTLLVHYGTWA